MCNPSHLSSLFSLDIRGYFVSETSWKTITYGSWRQTYEAQFLERLKAGARVLMFLFSIIAIYITIKVLIYRDSIGGENYMRSRTSCSPLTPVSTKHPPPLSSPSSLSARIFLLAICPVSGCIGYQSISCNTLCDIHR